MLVFHIYTHFIRLEQHTHTHIHTNCTFSYFIRHSGCTEGFSMSIINSGEYLYLKFKRWNCFLAVGNHLSVVIMILNNSLSTLLYETECKHFCSTQTVKSLRSILETSKKSKLHLAFKQKTWSKICIRPKPQRLSHATHKIRSKTNYKLLIAYNV